MKPILLTILDGVGMRKDMHGNAFAKANTPCFDYLWSHYPHALLEASGSKVGLPDGQMGNSEVGHMNIGSGRIVYQPLQFINQQIEDGTFFQNETLLHLIEYAKQNGKKLHIMGLLSDGGIHSHMKQLMAFIDLCQRQKMDHVFYHVFTDGRDTLPRSAMSFLDQLNQKIRDTGIGKIATISGRYYAMDRDNRWDRILKAYEVIVLGKGEKFASYQDAIAYNYEHDISDEFIVPAMIDESGMVEEGDAIFCFNYRPDRLRELFSVLSNPAITSLDRTFLPNLQLVTMMPVSAEVLGKHAFDLPKVNQTLGEFLSEQKIPQLRIAETEKYAHVTYFFDGGRELELNHCNRILIPSPKVTTYDLSPNMSALEITETLLKEMDKDIYQVIVLNFANGDMLGHTGNIHAAISSLETMDQCLQKLYDKILAKSGTMIVTADHGNCELMLDSANHVITSHTTSLVPFIVTRDFVQLKDGKLGDIAPTIIELLGLQKPLEMTGTSLIQK